MDSDKAFLLKGLSPSNTLTRQVKGYAQHNSFKISVHLRESAVELPFPGRAV
jgi:hypothetical protein